MKSLVVSYLTLRNLIGFTGILLPLIVAIGGFLSGNWEIQPSISAYYWTASRDIFVGVLFITSALLLTYNGYDLTDRITTLIAGISALGIALFPMFHIAGSVGYFSLSGNLTHIFHFSFAIIFFISLAFMSYFQFTKGNSSKEVKRKANKVYRTCGLVIIGSIALLAILMLIDKSMVDSLRITYILESVMLLAFGISWITKGKLLIKESSQ